MINPDTIRLYSFQGQTMFKIHSNDPLSEGNHMSYLIADGDKPEERMNFAFTVRNLSDLLEKLPSAKEKFKYDILEHSKKLAEVQRV